MLFRQNIVETLRIGTRVRKCYGMLSGAFLVFPSSFDVNFVVNLKNWLDIELVPMSMCSHRTWMLRRSMKSWSPERDLVVVHILTEKRPH